MTLIGIKTGMVPMSEQSINTLLDAIHIDQDMILNKFAEGSTETKQQLLSIWYFFNTKQRDSKYYQELFGMPIEDFQKSLYGQVLAHTLNLIHWDKHVWPKITKTEQQLILTLSALHFNQFAQGLAKSFEKFYQQTFQATTFFQNSFSDEIVIKEDKLLIQNEDGTLSEATFFVRLKGRIIPLSELQETDIPTIEAEYLAISDKVIETIPNTTGKVIINIYHKAVISQEGLDLTKSTDQEQMVLPPEIVNHLQYSYDPNGDKFTVSYHATEIESENAIAEQNTTSYENLSEVHASAQIQPEAKEDFKWVDAIRYMLTLNPLDGSDKAITNPFNWLVARLFQDLRNCYPKISEHSAHAIIGYILAQTGYLNKEDEHNDNQKSTYLTYLKYSIRNTYNSKETKRLITLYKQWQEDVNRMYNFDLG